MFLRTFSRVLALASAVLCVGSTSIWAQSSGAEAPSLPALPAHAGVLQPGPKTDGPYQPLPLAPDGIVIPLYPPDSPYLRADKIREPEQYNSYSPPALGYITSIHNPSLEFHAGNGQLNTGAVVILAAGGAHKTLGVGGEAIPFVSFFAHQGVNTVILRNRLRSDGYEPFVDGANDAMQAIKLVRAYAAQLKVDPAKIGIVGFSAGAELAALAGLQWEDFDRRNDVAGNPLAKVSSRPDFVGLIYPGPSPFSLGTAPAIPRAAPPAFIATPGWGDWIHCLWATDYFTAMLKDGVPNVEMHVYARGHHPGDKPGPGEPPVTGGLANMGGIAWGTWSQRYLEWMRDLGFLGAPGVKTRAAQDVEANLERKPRTWTPPPRPTPAAKP